MQRAELLRKIVTLEMQMLVKEIVDSACLAAEKASLTRLEVKVRRKGGGGSPFRRHQRLDR